jgi:predicted Zn-ribbon and HTH transcriptional regulator
VLPNKAKKPSDDSPFYMIELYHKNLKRSIKSIVMTPSECQQLLQHDFETQDEIGKGDLKIEHAKSIKLEAILKSLNLRQQEEAWTSLLKKAVYLQSKDELKFRK